MSRSANCVTSFHRRFVQNILDAERGERLIGVRGRRQVVQRTSPPVVHCITFGHFFGSHRSCLRRSLHGNTVELFSDKKCDDAVSHTTFEMRGEKKNTKQRYRGVDEEKKQLFQGVDPREKRLCRCAVPA